ncbi:MAG TPA: ATP-binding protein [Treponemataceae bacterium]|nr:ATP-binding protein [Treponemataceae bacterium]
MSDEILIDGASELFDRKGLHLSVFPSDYRQIRYYTLQLVQRSRPKTDERLLLEQQVSEIIKNAVKHGNGCDPSKTVKVWHLFTAESARLIVEDEGPGFADIEKWNIFNRKRIEYAERGDFVGLMSYVSWKTKKSDEHDGGNAMFAALEYWNDGVVYTERRNCVAVKKTFEANFMEAGGDE